VVLGAGVGEGLVVAASFVVAASLDVAAWGVVSIEEVRSP